MTSVTSVFSQGAWNIKYVSIDSLDSASIGKELRIDFKSFISDTLKAPVKNGFEVRKLLGAKRDTITLDLDGQFMQFVENWKLYVDQGSISDQILEEVENTAKQKVFIREMYLVSMDERTLTLEVIVHKSLGEKKEQNKKTIIINKSIVKGVLLEI